MASEVCSARADTKLNAIAVADPLALNLTLDIQDNGLPRCVEALHADTIPNGQEVLPGSLLECALAIMSEPDVFTKARMTFVTCAKWAAGSLRLAATEPRAGFVALESPARPSLVQLVAPGKLRSGNKKGMVHSIVSAALCSGEASHSAILDQVHAESYAIDLSWDIILRFGQQGGVPTMRGDFYVDWIRVSFMLETRAKRFLSVVPTGCS
jgi:hypothetical protein